MINRVTTIVSLCIFSIISVLSVLLVSEDVFNKFLGLIIIECGIIILNICFAFIKINRDKHIIAVVIFRYFGFLIPLINLLISLRNNSVMAELTMLILAITMVIIWLLVEYFKERNIEKFKKNSNYVYIILSTTIAVYWLSIISNWFLTQVFVT